MQNPMRFQIVPDTQGCHVRLTDALNHEIVYWTESYRDIRDARRAIALAKRNVATAPVVDLVETLRRILRAS